jgi:hypothetical protein
VARIDYSNTRATQTHRPTSTSHAAPLAPKPKPGEAAAKQHRDSFDSPSKNTARFGSGARNDMKRLAHSSKATLAANKDGSVTSSSSSTGGQTTRSQELTTSRGPLGDTRLNYTTNSKTGGRETTNTYSAARSPPTSVSRPSSAATSSRPARARRTSTPAATARTSAPRAAR